MRKAILFVPVLALSMLISCTAPTQRIASVAIQRGVEQEHNIINDLSVIAKQSAVDKGVAEARAAAIAGDADAAQSAVEKAVTQFDKIGWLQIQHERARSLIRFGQVYIWSQKGIFDLMVDEFKEAKNRANSNKTTAVHAGK